MNYNSIEVTSPDLARVPIKFCLDRERWSLRRKPDVLHQLRQAMACVVNGVLPTTR
jgi:hypothetical protein